MNFKKILRGLYNGSDTDICRILNAGRHSDQFDSENAEDLAAVHTGFYVKVQTDSVFECIYHIESQEIYFQRIRTAMRLPLGTPMYYTSTMYYFFECKDQIDEWYDSYDVIENRFNLIPIQRIEWENKRVVKDILLPSNKTIPYFRVYGDYGKAELFPLCPDEEPFLYKASSFHTNFEDFKREGRRYHKFNEKNEE